MRGTNMRERDWRDFISQRIDEACQRAQKTEEYAEDEQCNGKKSATAP
jgi:hypothetical protein